MAASSSNSAGSVSVAAFYKFAAIDNTATLQHDLRQFCETHAIKGTILLAREGINATVSGSEADIRALIEVLRADRRFADLPVKFSCAEDHPFRRLKVKIKPEIVTFGAGELPPSNAHAVEPEEWNALISDPDVLVIDTRNDYEVGVGTFAGARNPKTRAFREFPEFVARELKDDRKRKIAMFCTGGIRCEKASAYLLSEGFADVYQLKGGILKYLERIPSSESLWRGECFVFDERVALRHGVEQGGHALCARCGRPIKIENSRDDARLCSRCCAGTVEPSTAA